MLMLCPVCADSFQFLPTRCPSCGCNLIPATMDARTTLEVEARRKERVRFVELCRPRTFPLAMLIKQMLEQNEVSVLVQGANSLSLMPHLAFGGELRVMVDSGQLDFARSLYQAYFESEDDVEPGFDQ